MRGHDKPLRDSTVLASVSWYLFRLSACVDERVPLFLVEVLRAHIETFPPQGDLVFTSQGGALLRRSNFVRRTWAPAVARAGLDQRLTFHGLRHTAVSVLIAEGASIVELAAAAGGPWAVRVARVLPFARR